MANVAPTPLPKCNTKDFEIGDYFIPKVFLTLNFFFNGLNVLCFRVQCCFTIYTHCIAIKVIGQILKISGLNDF